jgi:ATP synthase protein I
MPQSDDQSREAIDRLDARLDAFEAERARPASGLLGMGGSGAGGVGYRMVSEIVSGLLGGAALGWLLDHFAGTAPWGIVGGLVLGSAAAIFLAARLASRMGAQSLKDHPAKSVPFDDDED